MLQVTLTFPEGKHKVLTLSYDDGKEADRKLISMMNRYGIKGTFHLNSGLLGKEGRISKDEAAHLYKGHEISAHTVTHPTIARSPKEQLIEEIIEDRKVLERIARTTVRGMSYPNGSYNREIISMLPTLGIQYARTVHSTGEFHLPNDFLEWHPTCHHNENIIELAEEFKKLHKKQYLYMMYVWGHSYEFDNDDNWELIEQFCESIGNRDDIWYATNIEIVDYMEAFQRLQFAAGSEFVYNPSAQAVWLQVDGDIMKIPGGKRIDLN